MLTVRQQTYDGGIAESSTEESHGKCLLHNG